MPLYQYILKRLLIALPILLVVSFLSFCIMRYDITLGPLGWQWQGHTVTVMEKTRFKNPVDPLAELRQNPAISRGALLQEEARLGLNQPFMTQYWLWLTHVLHFDLTPLRHGQVWAIFQPDFGKSYTGEDVTTILWSRIPNTLVLNLVTLIVSWGIAIPLGIVAALHWRRPADSFLTLFSSTGMAAPGFVIALCLGYLAVIAGWPPIGGVVSDNFDQMNPFAKVLDLGTHLLLPVTVLTIGSIAGLQRQMRGNLLDVLEAEYVRVARAKGLPERKVIYKHAVRTAINPLVTLMGYEFAGLLSGSALVEMVLRYPGLGMTALDAVRQGDTNLAMVVLIMSAALLILGNLVSDILLKVVDPRIELS